MALDCQQVVQNSGNGAPGNDLGIKFMPRRGEIINVRVVSVNLSAEI